MASAPQFRPVATYEAGRGPVFALGNNNAPNAPTPRRGFFGGFFGGGR
jgi:hypothetical protein